MTMIRLLIAKIKQNQRLVVLVTALCCVCLIIGFGFGVLGNIKYRKVSSHYREIRSTLATTTLSFTNPLLQCDDLSDYVSSDERHPLQKSIEQVISEQKNKGAISFASVYYRDLNNGPWMGINLDEKFFPASLMKIPVMLYYYKKAENDPKILTKKLDASKVPQEIVFKPYFAARQRIDLTKTYTVDELIDSMIENSDNLAASVLVYNMEPSGFHDVLKDLYIELPSDSTQDYISVRSYSTFFRVLYNASYLNTEYSEKALKLLSESVFKSGLKKYLPENAVVSHKFGEHEEENTGIKQLHDCGIVYVPKQPYLLCVMTRGTDMDGMADTIGLISKNVYEAMK